MKEADKQSKAEVRYGPGMPGSHCGICKHYERPSACALVAGEIKAADWCILFVKGGDQVPG